MRTKERGRGCLCKQEQPSFGGKKKREALGSLSSPLRQALFHEKSEFLRAWMCRRREVGRRCLLHKRKAKKKRKKSLVPLTWYFLEISLTWIMGEKRSRITGDRITGELRSRFMGEKRARITGDRITGELRARLWER